MAGISLKFLCILIIARINWMAAEHKHFNVDLLLKNERLFARFVDCIVDEGPCMGAIAKFKDIIPHLMETQCAECKEELKKLSVKIISHIRNNKPETWKKMQEKFDPDNQHREKIEELLKTYQ